MVLMNYTKIVYILVVVSIRIGGVMGHQIIKKYNALKEKYTNGLNFYLINKHDFISLENKCKSYHLLLFPPKVYLVLIAFETYF